MHHDKRTSVFCCCANPRSSLDGNHHCVRLSIVPDSDRCDMVFDKIQSKSGVCRPPECCSLQHMNRVRERRVPYKMHDWGSFVEWTTLRCRALKPPNKSSWVVRVDHHTTSHIVACLHSPHSLQRATTTTVLTVAFTVCLER